MKHTVGPTGNSFSSATISQLFFHLLLNYIINIVIMCHSISMGARPALLKSDWSRVGLPMDLLAMKRTKTTLYV